ncbi:unnamed protein product [Mytilus edulis]|uniref:Uncharacterized protein n=1 Tax=Mytilus edulis TaxID=6550 RepID=A0A8S3RSN4_MYTED|nr:unnamed protein product [Mytilus edulis]
MSNSSSAHDAQISMSDKFPFEIHEDEIDKSVTPIFKDYPRECLPEKFKNPSGAKAKKLQYEIIDPNLYEPPARMVACRIKRNRLEAWIRALGVLYYEHFGKKAELFQVDWYDDPHQWEGEGNKAICINLTNDKQLIYKITLFITTGVLQAQGLSKDLFTTRDFPTLIKLVNSICVHNPSLIVNTDVDSTCKSSDKNLIEESTSVKSVFNSTASSVDNKLTDSNNNSHTSIQANVPTSNTCTETTIATQAKISIGYEDLDRLQTTFVEALAGITKSQTALIVQAEKSFSDVIRSAITPVVETVKKLQEQVNNKHQSDTSLHNASTCNIKEHSNMEKQFNKLEHRIVELENQVHNLSMDKHKAATDYAELDSKFRIENNKFEIAKTRMDQKMEDINHINDDLKVKLNTKSSEMMKISEENKLLKEKTDSQFNEILSLKSQLSSMYLPTQQQNEQQFANGSFNNEGKSNKPTALFIGTSNTDRINENKLSTAVDITKTTAYTLDEAYEVISTAQCRPDVVIIHS